VHSRGRKGGDREECHWGGSLCQTRLWVHKRKHHIQIFNSVGKKGAFQTARSGVWEEKKNRGVGPRGEELNRAVSHLGIAGRIGSARAALRALKQSRGEKSGIMSEVHKQEALMFEGVFQKKKRPTLQQNQSGDNS